MTDPLDRPPWYSRAFQLFAHEHFDSDNAAMLARSEWQQQLRRSLDGNEPARSPLGRLVGAERNAP